MPPRKTRPDAALTRSSEKTFLSHLLQILREPYGGKNPALDDRQRLLDILALNSEYLRRSRADATYVARDKIAFISAALWLDDGVTHPIFQPKKLTHGKRLGSVIWRARVTIAIALDFLMKANVLEADALRQISKIPGIEKLLSGKNPSKEKSPKNWRTRLDSGLFPTDLVREQWDQSREFIAKLTGFPSEKRRVFKAEAKRLMAVAAELISEI